MKIFVKAKPNAKNEIVEELDSSHFVISVKAPPKNGRANEAIARALANHLNVSRSRVALASGFASKEKVFEVD